MQGRNANTLPIGADAQKGQFAKINGDGEAVPCDTEGEDAYGVFTNTYEEGDRGVIQTEGIADVLCQDNSVKLGDRVMTDANGEAIAYDDGTAGNWAKGKARNDARDGRDGDAAFLEIDLALFGEQAS